MEETPSACDRCGSDALGRIGDEALCESCLHEAGACCGSFGKPDPEGE